MVFVLGSHVSLSDVELPDYPDPAGFIRDAAAFIRDQPFDWIVIDPPPSLGPLQLAALAAADAVLCPVDIGPGALNGIYNLERALAWTNARFRGPDIPVGHPCYLAGVFVVKADAREPRMTEATIAAARAVYGDTVLSAIVRVDTNVKKATLAGLPVDLFAPRSRAAADYRALTAEIVAGLSRCGSQPRTED